jgi:hypothetical protein
MSDYVNEVLLYEYERVVRSVATFEDEIQRWEALADGTRVALDRTKKIVAELRAELVAKGVELPTEEA